MNAILKSIFFKYQKAMFYVAQTGSELGKPLRFFVEFGILILLLDKVGISLTIYHQILIYLGILIFAMIFGWFMVHIGVTKYNTTLANKQNEEIQEILKILKEKQKKELYETALKRALKK